MPRTLACLLLLAAAVARADDHPGRKDDRPAAHPAPHAARPAPPHPAPAPAVTVVVPPVVTSCWVDAHVFRSFTAGAVAYCRGHLDYVPGALDCYTFADQVCALYSPTSGWDEARQSMAPDLIACPDDVEPPVCPRFGWR